MSLRPARVAAVAFIFCAPNSFATPSQNSQKPATQSKEEARAEAPLPAQITLLETNVRFETNGDSRKEVHAVVKINNEIGVTQFARLNFDFNRAFQAVEIPLVRITHAGGGTADILPGAIADNPNPTVVHFPAYQDIRVKSIRVLGLGPGDALEYRVVTTTTHHPLAPDFWFEHSFDRSGVVQHEIFELNLPSRRARIHNNPETPATVTQSGEGESARESYRWDLQAAKLKPETEGESKSDVALTTFSSWSQLSGKLAKREGTGFGTRIYAEADDRLGGNGSGNTLRSLYQLVSQKIKTVDLPFVITLSVIRGAQQILESGYGTSEEKARLLQVLATQTANTRFLMYGSSTNLENELPRPTLLSGSLLLGTERGREYFVDPGMEVAPFGLVRSDLRGHKALEIAELGPSHDDPFVVISRDVPFQPKQVVTVNAALAEDGALTASVKYRMRGDNELLLRVAFHQTAREKWNDVAQLLALSDGFRGKVTKTTASDPYETHDPFTVEYEIAQPKFIDWTKKPVRVPALLPLLGLPDLPPKAAAGEAPAPIELGTPLDVEVSTTLHLPEGTGAAVPAGTSVERDFATYSSKYSVNGAAVTASRHINFILREIPADRYADYNAFLRTVQNDESQFFTLERAATPETERKP